MTAPDEARRPDGGASAPVASVVLPDQAAGPELPTDRARVSAPESRPAAAVGVPAWLRQAPALVGHLKRRLPAAIVLLTMLGLWVYGASTYFIPCRRDCGEVFDALQYVDNYRLYGFAYGLVQDYATSAAREAHPYFYTHNVNLAGIVFTLLEAVGLRPFWAKQLVTLTVFGAGLAYVFRATAYHSRSWLAGIVVLALFVTDVDHVLAFSLNPLRVWHLLAIFGLLFHVGRLTREPHHSPRLDRAAIVLLACVAFGIGYDFWVTSAGIAAAVAVLGRGRRLFRWGTVLSVAGLVVAFAVPFVLRQVQIAAVLGPTFWFMDVVYSAAIKVSVLSRFITVPPTAELDEIYQAAGVHRPPANPSSTIHSILLTLGDMIQYLVLPSYGTLTIWLATSAALLAILGTVLVLVARPRRCVQLLARCGIVGQERAGLVGSARMIAALVLAMLAGLAFFAPLSLHIYLKHEFPLVVGPILLVKGLAIAAAVALFGRLRGRWPASAVAVLGVAGILVLDHAIVQAETVRAREPMPLTWIPAVMARHEGTFAVSWIPGAVSVYTDSWAAGVPPGKERELQARLVAGQPLFALSDYFLFGERDAAQNPKVYTQPDYWLYFPTEHTHPFDAPRPDCRQDYLGRMLNRVRGGADAVVPVDRFYASPGHTRPGSVVTFGARIERSSQQGISAELFHNGRVVASLNYNCQYGVILGEYRLPETGMSGMQRFTGRLLLPGGRAVPLGDADVLVADDGPPEPPRLPSARPPQPGVDEMVRLFRSLAVAERGGEYVIFDLRPHFGRP